MIWFKHIWQIQLDLLTAENSQSLDNINHILFGLYRWYWHDTEWCHPQGTRHGASEPLPGDGPPPRHQQWTDPGWLADRGQASCQQRGQGLLSVQWCSGDNFTKTEGFQKRGNLCKFFYWKCTFYLRNEFSSNSIYTSITASWFTKPKLQKV